MLVFYRKAVIIGFTRILTKRDDGEEAMKPNIVFITSDQQRRDSLGIYGCRYVSTPNLDRLGSQATVYEHCYCNAPVCTPSRACMMTGKTMPGHGVYNLFDILPENEKMLPYYLREQGY